MGRIIEIEPVQSLSRVQSAGCLHLGTFTPLVHTYAGRRTQAQGRRTHKVHL
jgi:hypothetical protein